MNTVAVEHGSTCAVQIPVLLRQVAGRLWAAPVNLLGLLLTLWAAPAQGLTPPPVVKDVDLVKYSGTWYEQARLPLYWENECWGVTVTYRPLPDGRFQVSNTCRLGGPQGQESGHQGLAWVEDNQPAAKLKVQFFWPIRGDYWILALGPNYEWSLVGTPDREHLWILSRTPLLEEAIYQDLVALGQQLGYPVQQLIVTGQPQTPELATPVAHVP